MRYSRQPMLAAAIAVFAVSSLVPAAAQRDSLRVLARAEPSKIGAGQRTTIFVEVSLPRGGSAAGATVNVASGGGQFSSSGSTSASGNADANGRFQVDWACDPCARGYVINVHAELPGYGKSTTVTVWIDTSGPSLPKLVPPLAGASDSTLDKLDLNKASEKELTKLPGIGSKLAKRIVVHRQQHGPFQRVEDLVQVQGIGQKSLQKLSPYLTVGGQH